VEQDDGARLEAPLEIRKIPARGGVRVEAVDVQEVNRLANLTSRLGKKASLTVERYRPIPDPRRP
jgi:hypothetical protein